MANNNEYEQQQFFMQEISKNFKNNEIKGTINVDGKKVIYLKEGVKRKYYNDSIDPEELESHLNQELLVYQKAEKYYKYIEGTDDYENN